MHIKKKKSCKVQGLLLTVYFHDWAEPSGLKVLTGSNSRTGRLGTFALINWPYSLCVFLTKRSKAKEAKQSKQTNQFVFRDGCKTARLNSRPPEGSTAKAEAKLWLCFECAGKSLFPSPLSEGMVLWIAKCHQSPSKKENQSSLLANYTFTWFISAFLWGSRRAWPHFNDRKQANLRCCDEILNWLSKCIQRPYNVSSFKVGLLCMGR